MISGYDNEDPGLFLELPIDRPGRQRIAGLRLGAGVAQ